MFIMLVSSIYLGIFKNICFAYRDNDISGIVFNVLPIVFMTFTQTQILTVMCNQSALTELIKSFHIMQKDNDDGLNHKRWRKFVKIAKYYEYFLNFILIISLPLKMAGFDSFKLYCPALYDEMAVGHFYYPLLVLNFFHTYWLEAVMSACDMLPILLLARVDVNLRFLCDRLRHCTDNIDLQVNEQELIKCIKYHSVIIGWEFQTFLIFITKLNCISSMFVLN